MPHIANSMDRVKAFCDEYGLRIPILMAPMAGACPPALATAVANAGGMGACGALLMNAEGINTWVSDVRDSTNGAFQLNTWIPDPQPVRDLDHEKAVRDFLGDWGPEVPASEADAPHANFTEQCDAMINANPRVMSSIMGVFPPDIVERMKRNGKQADTAAPLMPMRQAPHWLACLPCCHRWSMQCRCLLWQPAASPMQDTLLQQ